MKVSKIVKKIVLIILIICGILFILITIALAVMPMISRAQYSTENNEQMRRETEELQDAYGLSDEESGTDNKMDKSEEKLFFRKDSDKERETGKKEEPEKRMKVFFGFLRLLVDNAKNTRGSISTLADEVGGYVESSYENTIIIRVPKELFAEVLIRLMDMGEVLNKIVETYDVTDLFQDLAARLDISKKTRDRLYNLLERTTDVKERLIILKEIRRLSEEIEKITMTLESIKRFISFSRITIELEQRLSDLSSEDKRLIPFPWIAQLDPFYASLSQLQGKIKLKTGDEFAVFDNKKYLFAESTEGVRIRIASTKNTPHGDTGFWQRAVEYHLSRFYEETLFLELGEFKAVRFKSKDADPFYYMVGVAVKGDKLFVCEVLFPNQAAIEGLGEAVEGYIKDCKIN